MEESALDVIYLEKRHSPARYPSATRVILKRCGLGHASEACLRHDAGHVRPRAGVFSNNV